MVPTVLYDCTYELHIAKPLVRSLHKLVLWLSGREILCRTGGWEFEPRRWHPKVGLSEQGLDRSRPLWASPGVSSQRVSIWLAEKRRQQYQDYCTNKTISETEISFLARFADL